MLVAAHGNVDEYCEAHGMTIVERYEGDVANYKGGCSVLVTDNCETVNEYYYLKHRLYRRKIELLSTHWSNEDLESFVTYMNSKTKNPVGRRLAFGFKYEGGQVVEDPETIWIARRIIELRDRGWLYREIQADEGVRYPDGRVMPLSTIQVILQNRKKYK